MTEQIFAPCLGRVFDIAESSDPAFAAGHIGDGVFILPESPDICAPVDGVVDQIFSTNHAFSIHSQQGHDLLIHIGVETIQLKGRPFRRMVEPGTAVQRGTPIIRADFPLIRRKRLDPSVMVVAVDETGPIVKHCPARCADLNSALFSIGSPFC